MVFGAEWKISGGMRLSDSQLDRVSVLSLSKHVAELSSEMLNSFVFSSEQLNRVRSGRQKRS